MMMTAAIVLCLLLSQAPATTPMPAAEKIVEIRVHGNVALPDAEVIQTAGVAIGDEVGADTLRSVEDRLKASNRFEVIEVRKRYRSLDDPTAVSLVLLVHEKRGTLPTMKIPGVPLIGRPGARYGNLMFLPILSYADGYGFTYGGRMGVMDVAGTGGRLSVPLTWGGTRRAAVEAERTFKRGPVHRVDGSVGIWQRQNPHFEIDDRRVELRARAGRQLVGPLHASFETSRANIDFGGTDDTLWTAGANLVFDTRLDPIFPGNAIFAGVGWTSLNFSSQIDAINKYRAEVRGYVRVFRQAVIASRVLFEGADRVLPPYAQLLLGGAGTLRGHRAGSFIGDRMFITSTEVRVPLNSPLHVGRMGLTLFFDAGAVYNRDEPLSQARFHRGAGGGVFLVMPVVKINLDVARGLDSHTTRVHLSSGFAF